MAVFIRKENLGSQDNAARRFRQKIESTPAFQHFQAALAKEKNERASKLKGKYEDNAEVQNWRRKSKEQQTREAIDLMIPTTKAVQQGRTGKEVTHEEARKVAEDIANLCDRKKAEK